MPTPPDSFTTTLSVHRPSHAVYAAILDVRAWWTGVVDGPTDQLGGEFTYRYEALHRSTQRVVELVPGRRIVWKVVASELRFVTPTDEWTGTEIVFELVERAGVTELRFTHLGLVPALACWKGCTGGWSYYIDERLREHLGRVSPGRDTGARR